jgi:hypothetical protein
MKYLIPVLMGGAAISVTITTAVAQAHGAFTGNASLKPYLYGYGAAATLLLIALIVAINAGRQESKASDTSKHKEINARLAALMKREREIHVSFKSASDDGEYTELIRKANDWTNDIGALLNEAGLPTDAQAFSQVGHAELSSEQLARFAHVHEWKREVIARFALYCQTLDQIRSNRRL